MVFIPFAQRNTVRWVRVNTDYPVNVVQKLAVNAVYYFNSAKHWNETVDGEEEALLFKSVKYLLKMVHIAVSSRMFQLYICSFNSVFNTSYRSAGKVLLEIHGGRYEKKPERIKEKRNCEQ